MTSMIKSDGAFLVFFQRPIAGVLGVLTLVVWAGMAWHSWRARQAALPGPATPAP
jgi:hypothetical protein